MNIRKEISEIIDETNCGYCESEHNHDEAQKKLVNQTLELFKKYALEMVGEVAEDWINPWAYEDGCEESRDGMEDFKSDLEQRIEESTK